MIKIKNVENINDDDTILPFQMNTFLHSTKRNLNWPSADSISKTSLSKRFVRQTEILITEQSFKQAANRQSSSQDFSDNVYANVNFGLVAQTLNHKKNRKQEHFKLKHIIAEQKTKQMVKNFVKKIRRNNMNAKPVEYEPFQTDEQFGLSNMQGFQLSEKINNIMAVLSVIQIVSLTIIYTLAIVFQQVNQSTVVTNFQTISLIFYLVEIIINFLTIKQEEGKRVTKLSEICNLYLKNNFPIDCISLIILIIDLSFSWYVTAFLRLFIVTKLFQALQKMQRLQVNFVSNFYMEQYWSLAKVFIFNFCFAHFLAITLVAMSNINKQQNWMDKKGINDSHWLEQYIWSYYWGTTIMLTVGFGDLCASTYQEALVLTFLQMISCMALAYNINCVGNLISNIRSQDLQKSKNFRVFKKLAEKNNVTEDLQWRINNYIEESSNIRKKFNYEEQNNFVQKLPKGLKTQFLKQSNKKIFQNLPFFKNLMEKTLFSFAEKIEMRICHPQEVVQNIDENLNLQILKGGTIGFCVKKGGCSFNDKVIDQIEISDKDEPYLIDLNFIRKNQKIFTIKSLEYSILYCLDYENIINILKGSQMDYQLYCLLRDKSSHIPDQFQLFKCTLCNQSHNKFKCPKLHYVPFYQQVINKYVFKVSIGKCERSKEIGRILYGKTKTLKSFLNMSLMAARKPQYKNLASTQKKVTNLFNTKGKKFEQIREDSPTIGRQFQQIKNFFSQNTAELIKNQIGKALKNNEASDEVWTLQLDRMKNYKSYFQFDNSFNLCQKFALSKRRRTSHLYQDQHTYTVSISRNNPTQKEIE